MTGERKVTVLRSDHSLIDQEFDSIRERFEAEMKKMEEEMSRFRSQLINSERDRMIMSTAGLSTTGESARNSSRPSNHSANQQQQHQTTTKTHEEHQQHQKQLFSNNNSQLLANSPATTRTATTKEHRTTTTTRTVNSGDELIDQNTEQQSSDQPKSWLDELNSPLIQEGEAGRMLKLRFDVKQYEPEQIVVKTVDNRLQVHAKHEEKTGNRSVYREYNREFLLPEGTDPELIKSSLSRDGVLTVEAPLPTPSSISATRKIPVEKA